MVHARSLRHGTSIREPHAKRYDATRYYISDESRCWKIYTAVHIRSIALKIIPFAVGEWPTAGAIINSLFFRPIFRRVCSLRESFFPRVYFPALFDSHRFRFCYSQRQFARDSRKQRHDSTMAFAGLKKQINKANQVSTSLYRLTSRKLGDEASCVRIKRSLIQ